MFEDHEPEYVNPTAEEVLEVFRAEHRYACAFGEADETIDLGSETTVDQWQVACDLLAWQDIGRALNDEWRIDVDDVTWRALLTPPKKRTLGELCEYLAYHIRLPRARPARLLGRPCISAGVFLTVRTMLAKAGVDVSDLSPSSPLEPYARGHLSTFMAPVSRLARCGLPELRIRDGWHFGAIAASAGAGCLLTSWLMDWLARGHLQLEAFAALLACLGAIALAASQTLGLVVPPTPPRLVQFGELRTFRDLSNYIADSMRNVALDHAALNRQLPLP